MNNKLVHLKSFWFITHLFNTIHKCFIIHLFSPCTQTFHVFSTWIPHILCDFILSFSVLYLWLSHFLFSFPFTGFLSVYNTMVLMSNTKLPSLSTIAIGWYTAWWFIVFNFTWQLYNWQQPAQEYYYSSIFFKISFISNIILLTHIVSARDHLSFLESI